MLAVKSVSILQFCPFLLQNSQATLGRFIHKLSLNVWALGLYDTTAHGIVHNIDKLQMSLGTWQERAMFS